MSSNPCALCFIMTGQGQRNSGQALRIRRVVRLRVRMLSDAESERQ